MKDLDEILEILNFYSFDKLYSNLPEPEFEFDLDVVVEVAKYQNIPTCIGIDGKTFSSLDEHKEFVLELEKRIYKLNSEFIDRNNNNPFDIDIFINGVRLKIKELIKDYEIFASSKLARDNSISLNNIPDVLITNDRCPNNNSTSIESFFAFWKGTLVQEFQSLKSIANKVEIPIKQKKDQSTKKAKSVIKIKGRKVHHDEKIKERIKHLKTTLESHNILNVSKIHAYYRFFDVGTSDNKLDWKYKADIAYTLHYFREHPSKLYSVCPDKQVELFVSVNGEKYNYTKRKYTEKNTESLEKIFKLFTDKVYEIIKSDSKVSK